MSAPSISPPQPQIGRPHPLLAAHVRRYLEIRFDTPRNHPILHRISALAEPVLVLTLSGKAAFGVDDATLEPIPPVSLSGPLVSSVVNRYRGAMHGFMVRFTPWGMRTLLGVWGTGIANKMFFPEDVVPADVRVPLRDWADRLLEAPDFATRATLTDAFLLDRLRDPAILPASVQPALNAIKRTSGALPVAALAQRLGTAESTLRRNLVETTGASPKLHAQIIRFRHAWGFLRTSPQVTWADVVNRFGYTDQSHFIHEHRRFSGQAPGAMDVAERFMDRSMGLGDDGPRG